MRTQAAFYKGQHLLTGRQACNGNGAMPYATNPYGRFVSQLLQATRHPRLVLSLDLAQYVSSPSMELVVDLLVVNAAKESRFSILLRPLAGKWKLLLGPSRLPEIMWDSSPTTESASSMVLSTDSLRRQIAQRFPSGPTRAFASCPRWQMTIG
jgi:hypothetical protein